MYPKPDWIYSDLFYSLQFQIIYNKVEPTKQFPRVIYFFAKISIINRTGNQIQEFLEKKMSQGFPYQFALKLISTFLFLGLLVSCQVPPSAPGTTVAPLPTETTMPTPAAGDVRTDLKGIEQVWVPAGSFLMGTDQTTIDELMALKPPGFVIGEFASEQPQHEVHITNGYWIDKYEVTNQAFQVFVKDGGYQDKKYWSEKGWAWLSKQRIEQLPRDCLGNLPGNPVACISWYEAEAYANWRGGRLPTEAEWEYAARGPDSLNYPWGNEFDASRCNVVNSNGLKPVGSYPSGASWVGALDMTGNVMEWVQDWLGKYPRGTLENPTGPETGRIKVEKGGWWGSNLFVARFSLPSF